MKSYLKRKTVGLGIWLLNKLEIMVHFDHSQGTWVIEKWNQKPLVKLWLTRSIRAKLAKVGYYS